jgi:hypothetical protein
MIQVNSERSAIIAFPPTYAQPFLPNLGISVTSFILFLLVFLICCIWAAACCEGGAGHFSPFTTVLIPQPNWVHVPQNTHAPDSLTRQSHYRPPFEWTLIDGVRHLYSLHVLRPPSNRSFTTSPRPYPRPTTDSTLVLW